MASSAAAAYAAMVQAVKASGAIIRIEPDAFMIILSKMREPLVVTAVGGIFKKEYRYLTSYKGLIFFTKSGSQLMLPGSTEVVFAKEIWIPG
jgi:hypothetical protein